MPCKLCGSEKKLIEAHIIPRSFHRINPNDKQPTRLLTNAEGRYTQKLPKGAYDSTIVCEDCERRFSVWDNYGDEIFLKSWDKFEKLERSGEIIGYRLSEYDYPKLKLFFMSVLWRAAVSSHALFASIDLGPKEPILRNSILNSDPGDIDHFGVVLQAFDTTEVGILNPHPERFAQFSGLLFCRFYLSHVIAFIKVDSRPFDKLFRSMALGSGRELQLAQKNFLTSPERRIMKNLVDADAKRNQQKY
jgi:hypothetical protein